MRETGNENAHGKKIRIWGREIFFLRVPEFKIDLGRFFARQEEECASHGQNARKCSPTKDKDTFCYFVQNTQTQSLAPPCQLCIFHKDAENAKKLLQSVFCYGTMSVSGETDRKILLK